MRSHHDSQPNDPQTRVVGLRDSGAEPLVRAGDDDRRRVTDLLQAHYVAGRLTQIELETRLQEAVASRTIADLDALLADLPDIAAPQATYGEGRQGRPSREERRQRRRHAAGACGERSFRGHATSYLLVMGLLVVIWALTSPGGYFWPVWPMIAWGIGLAAHGLAARKHLPAADGHWRAFGSH